MKLFNVKELKVWVVVVCVFCYWCDKVEGVVDFVEIVLGDDYFCVCFEVVRVCSFFLVDEVLEMIFEVLNYDMDKWIEYILEEMLKILEGFE